MKKLNILLMYLIFFSFGLSLVLPIFNKNNIVADESLEPYIYEYAPSNSFGATVFKFVNWNFFKDFFSSRLHWNMEYKRYSSSSWTNGNQYVDIVRTWNESGFWKFSLELDVPVDIYSVRFTFAMDKTVLSYVNRTDHYVYDLNVPIEGTNEFYNVSFNWSDMANIPNMVFTHGVQNNLFWFRFRRDNVPAGSYVFDPTFGYTGTGGVLLKGGDRWISYGPNPFSCWD